MTNDEILKKILTSGLTTKQIEEQIKKLIEEKSNKDKGNNMNNYNNTTEDEISKLSDNTDFFVKEKLARQYKDVAGIKSFLETLDFVRPDIKNINPIYYAEPLFNDEYMLFRAACPKLWKKTQAVLAKKMAEYNKLEAEREAAKAKLPWYKRIFA